MAGMLSLLLVAAAIGVATLVFLRGWLSGGGGTEVSDEGAGDGDSMNFAERLVSQKKRLVIFYGSQTGTAEEYAIKIAREAKSRYGTSALVLDPENEEMDKLDQIPADCAAVFVMATYGEGEPTDNAVPMVDFLKSSDVAFSNGSSQLENLHYVALGLGNRTYEYYNETVREVDQRLSELGATRIGPRGEGDDDKSLEEDYLTWKDEMFPQLAAHLNLEEGATGDIADFEVAECDAPEKLFLGEYHTRALNGFKGAHDQRNPYAAPVSEIRELFAEGTADRSCVHAEFDITGSGITYQHGDHLGVWPCNPDPQVERFLAVLGLQLKRAQPVSIRSLDPQLAKVPFPAPTTYEAALRYYLDINAHASRLALASFAPYAPSDEARARLDRLSRDRDHFREYVSDRGLKLAQVLQFVAGDSLADTDVAKSTVWPVPFDRVISAVPRLGPRYYSISSSPKLCPDKVHVTAVALQYATPQGGTRLYGLASNFLSHLKMTQNRETPIAGDPRHGAPAYVLHGPRDAYRHAADSGAVQYRVPIHVRRSTFRLPTSTKIPIIMVGPGTGVAPFRSFVQERVATARKAHEKLGEDALKDWADISLYYGCRRRAEDYLYEHEWPEYSRELGGKLRVRVALSREVFKPDGSKLYVQDLIWDDRALLAPQILNQRAYIYICGEAKGMSQDVENTLARILADAKGGDEELGRAEVKLLKERNRLMLDVWS
ncbi:NADPH--hemoprotein reductase [Malassezia sp. CBS 17886]|nr:NADPH--hemoprotein reductase [Malassezia sp. CBS 17886]